MYRDYCHTGMDRSWYILGGIFHLATDVICLVPSVERPQTRIKRESVF